MKTINEAMMNLRENEINDKDILNTLKKIKAKRYHKRKRRICNLFKN